MPFVFDLRRYGNVVPNFEDKSNHRISLLTSIQSKNMQAIHSLTLLLYFINTTNCASLILKEAIRSTEFNTAPMADVLRKIDILNLHLTSNDDAANDVVQYLLEQSVCAKILTVENVTRGSAFIASQRHRAIAIPIQNLGTTLNKFATRSGILICILLDKFDDKILLDVAKREWINRGIHKVYYVSSGRNVFFNPFARSSNGFGVLIDMHVMHLEDIFKDLNGYTIRTYIFDSVYSSVFGDALAKQITSARGADGNVAQLLSKKLNFTMDLQWPDDEFFGSHLGNGSYNGAIGRMMRYETDITLTGFFVKDYLTRDVEFSVSVYMDELCCYVMKAKRIPQSILPLFAVDVDVWLGFLLVGMISPLIWMGIRQLNMYFEVKVLSSTKSVHRSSNMRIFIDTWVVWVRVNIVRFPPFHSERIFVISLCLVSVIFGALFESSLATVYIRPLYYKDINTMQELDEGNLRIYIKHPAMMDDLFYGHSSGVFKNLDKKLLLVAETEERLISMMSKRGGFAAVTRASSLVLDDIRYFITKKIHKIPECPKNYHIAFAFPKKSPYEKPINILLLRFVEAGLIDQWIDETKFKATISMHNFPDYVAELGDKWKVLTIKDLQLGFYTLAFGCTLATLAVVGETIFSVCNYSKTNLVAVI